MGLAADRLKKLNISVPVSVFADRDISALEALVKYLKDTCDFSYHEIAVLLNRDDRTIWTTHNRRKSKS
jgi:hypothetical protein